MKNKCEKYRTKLFKNKLCQKHYEVKIRGWRERSQYRQTLGLCGRCTQPKMSGKQHCLHHIQMFREYSKKRREAQAKLRGWKLQRIKV